MRFPRIRRVSVSPSPAEIADLCERTAITIGSPAGDLVAGFSLADLAVLADTMSGPVELLRTPHGVVVSVVTAR